MKKDSEKWFRQGLTFSKDYTPANITYTGLIEFIKPVIQLVIAGAGNDAIPLADTASILGWDIVVADGRANQATRQRFPNAQEVLVAKPDNLLGQLETDGQTVFVLMTHNFNYDRDLLKYLVQLQDCRYIGSLGPKKKLERMLSELREQGITIGPEQLNRIYGPVGLDIGSETPEEIALSIVSEIRAVLSGRPGTSLRDKLDSIHSAPGHGPSSQKAMA